ncbi:MAG: hypothetical protein U0Q22_18975 [Acidimicrobiales bacterium]
MTFEIFVAYPPDRESGVAEIHVRDGDTVHIPAEVFFEGDVLRIRMFSRGGSGVWQYPLDEWLSAIRRAAEALGCGP